MSDWDGAEADLIGMELARIVLGGRGSRRPEQRMDMFGSVFRAGIAIRLAQMDEARRTLPALQRFFDALKADPDLARAIRAKRGGEG